MSISGLNYSSKYNHTKLCHLLTFVTFHKFISLQTAS